MLITQESHLFPIRSPASSPRMMRGTWSHFVLQRMKWTSTMTLCRLQPPVQVTGSPARSRRLPTVRCASPPEQPAKNRLDMRSLQSGRQVAAPQIPAPFFPEVHKEISRSWHSPYSARASGSCMFSSVDGADCWGYTKPLPHEPHRG